MAQFGYYIAKAQCLNRTCDQLIVGRNLPYSRVTRIILSQEYLDAADLDAIRRRGNTYTNYVLFCLKTSGTPSPSQILILSRVFEASFLTRTAPSMRKWDDFQFWT